MPSQKVVRFDVLKTVLLKNQVVQDMVLCHLVWFGLVEQVLPDILKHHIAFILRDKRHYQHLSLKMKAPQNLKKFLEIFTH